jgi:hypothetical protein
MVKEVEDGASTRAYRLAANHDGLGHGCRRFILFGFRHRRQDGRAGNHQSGAGCRCFINHAGVSLRFGTDGRSLAEEGYAPVWLNEGELKEDEPPKRGNLFSGAAMLAGVGAAKLLPGRFYLFLVSSGGFAMLFSYPNFP